MPLAMPGEHDRLVGVDALEEIVESLADIGIGGVDSLLGLGLIGQEGAPLPGGISAPRFRPPC